MNALPVLEPSPASAFRRHRLSRLRLASARSDRLYFAQVREDPQLEIDAIQPLGTRKIVVVGSGGCTALSLLGAGAACVVAVDLNTTQNHLIELKAAAIHRFTVAAARAFLGGTGSVASHRWALYTGFRQDLSDAARAYWDAHPGAIRTGVIRTGVSERLIALMAAVIRLGIHPRARIERLLACSTLDQQREFYKHEWNTRRWRMLFRIVLNRRVFDRTYDPTFFAHVENPSFAEHFRQRAEYTLTEIPVATNYFLHQMLTGCYPAHAVEGVPPYLSEVGARTIRRSLDRLSLVDGTYADYLRGCPDGSIDAFAISNICEWLSPAEVDRLFAEIVRTAVPGARLCFRNFVGWTEVPERWRGAIVEDRARGEALMRRDRSMVQRRFAVCHVRKETA
jgi:S-adenosylmethionine-diacylglycerol 3-amino-3-carboxypropyl transferase